LAECERKKTNKLECTPKFYVHVEHNKENMQAGRQGIAMQTIERKQKKLTTTKKG
jgi:hypothetical protein